MPQGKRNALKAGQVKGSGTGCGCVEVKRNMQRMNENQQARYEKVQSFSVFSPIVNPAQKNRYIN